MENHLKPLYSCLKQMSISKSVFPAQHWSRNVNIGEVMPIICLKRTLKAWSWPPAFGGFGLDWNWNQSILLQTALVKPTKWKCYCLDMGWNSWKWGFKDLRGIFAIMLGWNILSPTLIYVQTVIPSLQVALLPHQGYFFVIHLGSENTTVKGEKDWLTYKDLPPTVIAMEISVSFLENFSCKPQF